MQYLLRIDTKVDTLMVITSEDDINTPRIATLKTSEMIQK